MKDHFPGNRPNGLRWPHTQIVVVEKHKLLYCPIAKNACSSLKRLMVSVSDIEHRDLIAEDIHVHIDLYRTGAKLLDHDIEHARHVMRSGEYFKFAVIRDVFSRLASAYIEKFVLYRHVAPNQFHTGPVVAAVQGTDSPDFHRCITFAQFIQNITQQAPESLDPHWKPQTLYLRGVDYDRIYRMDQLDLLQRDLEDRLGRPIDLEHRNSSHSGHARYVSGAAHMYPEELGEVTEIDKQSFMESEIMYQVVHFFADDYRLYYSPQLDSPRAPHTDTPTRWCPDLSPKSPPENPERQDPGPSAAVASASRTDV